MLDRRLRDKTVPVQHFQNFGRYPQTVKTISVRMHRLEVNHTNGIENEQEKSNIHFLRGNFDMNRLWDIGLLLLRVGTGLLLIANHGWSKLMSAYGYVALGKDWKFIEGVAKMGFPLPAFFAIAAAMVESIGSVLLILGLFTRYAALFIGITMGVAIYRHLTTDFRYELAAMYLLIAIALMLLPPGRFSLDAKRK